MHNSYFSFKLNEKCNRTLPLLPSWLSLLLISTGGRSHFSLNFESSLTPAFFNYYDNYNFFRQPSFFFNFYVSRNDQLMYFKLTDWHISNRPTDDRLTYFKLTNRHISNWPTDAFQTDQLTEVFQTDQLTHFKLTNWRISPDQLTYFKLTNWRISNLSQQ